MDPVLLNFEEMAFRMGLEFFISQIRVKPYLLMVDTIFSLIKANRQSNNGKIFAMSYPLLSLLV